MTTFGEALLAAVRAAAAYNKNDQVAPAVILWPDPEREWEPLLPHLRTSLPLLTLGDYDPAHRAGPAIWLRCMVDRTLEEDLLPEDEVPVVYLPGVKKETLERIEFTPELLQPLAPLQFIGEWFVQPGSGHEWSIADFIREKQAGLAIEIAANGATRGALLGAREKLFDLALDGLRRNAPLRAEYFNTLLQPDMARDLLLWLNDTEQARSSMSEDVWNAFRAQCQSQFAMDPASSTPIEFAEHLGRRESLQWAAVWNRYAEAPDRYPGVMDRLRAAKPKRAMKTPVPPDAWPQDNEDQEKHLREAFSALSEVHAEDARSKLLLLDESHGGRREWVWAKLGQSPLAGALSHLKRLAEVSKQNMIADSPQALAEQYAEWGWQVDDAALRALGSVDRQPDVAAVRTAVRAVYEGWLVRTAERFQASVAASGYIASPPMTWPVGTAVVFCDGLRLDLAHRLSDELKQHGYSVELGTRLTALPSITSTAKPAASPVASELVAGSGLDPAHSSGGNAAQVAVLRKYLGTAGYEVLQDANEIGDPAGHIWTEAGDVDELGHKQPSKLPSLAQREVDMLEERVASLLEAGWQRVVVVTDHGWLLMPGGEGLGKVDLPLHVADQNMRKGRCARLKPGAVTDMQTVPWHWDGGVSIAMAPGIACFQAGKEYEHGGLSLQECVTPVLVATKPSPAAVGGIAVAAHWRGLRCLVETTSAPPGALVDVRSKAGDPASSLLVSGPQPLNVDGRASMLVENEDYLEHAAFVVLLTSAGQVVRQETTTVGAAE